MAPPSYPVCSPGSAIVHQSSVVSFRPLPAFSLSMIWPQAVTLSQFCLRCGCFPWPLPMDCGFDLFRPSVGGSHQAMAE